MSERIIRTGLSKKYKDMLDSVIGQMSDGYWENTPMMRGYWMFVTTGTSGDEVTLNVDMASGERDGDRLIDNRFYGMPDDAVKKFFADKIKFLIKEEELGKWDRGNENETDYLSYGKPRYRVKDCYYAYEILKGRNARKHPEYGDVEESRQPVKSKMAEKAINEINTSSYAEWLRQAVTRIDDIVEGEIGDHQGDPNFDEDDMLMTADIAINDVMEEDGLNVNEKSPLRTIIATDLAREWLEWAYSQWYTGDTPLKDNIDRLVSWATEVR